MTGIFGLRFSNLEALKSLNRNQFIKDVISGIIVAVIALAAFHCICDWRRRFGGKRDLHRLSAKRIFA